jgi:hypothetical protein
MGHSIKNQRPYEYRPNATRRASGLERVNESNENAVKRWNKLRQQIKSMVRLERNIRTKGSAIRGRFKMTNPKKTSPTKNTQRVTLWKNTPPGVYFMSQPYKKGRFVIENIHGFVPFPSKKRTNAKSP